MSQGLKRQFLNPLNVICNIVQNLFLEFHRAPFGHSLQHILILCSGVCGILSLYLLESSNMLVVLNNSQHRECKGCQHREKNNVEKRSFCVLQHIRTFFGILELNGLSKGRRFKLIRRFYSSKSGKYDGFVSINKQLSQNLNKF